MRKGTVLINTQDLIGFEFNDFTVASYQGKEYANTKGGERTRHYCLCRHICGAYKSFQRGQILSKNHKPKRCFHCGYVCDEANNASRRQLK